MVPSLDLHLQLADLFVEFLEMIHQSLHQQPGRAGPLVGGIFDQLRHPLGNVGDPLRNDEAELSEETAYLVAQAMRALTKPWRTRCSDRTDCCSMFLIGTNLMFGRATASQIASASLASFLLVFTYGLTNCGAIS